jgi:hypothetical protein
LFDLESTIFFVALGHYGVIKTQLTAEPVFFIATSASSNIATVDKESLFDQVT